METLATFFIILLVLFNVFMIVAIIIEKNLSEDHPVMGWWRKHIIGKLPDDDPNF
jgi:hypothetical protein